MKKLIITTALALVASSVWAENKIDFSVEQYQKDLDVLIPLAVALKSECSMGDATKCAQSNSLMRLIKQDAMLNPSGEVLSEEEAEQFKQEFLIKAAVALDYGFESLDTTEVSKETELLKSQIITSSDK
ncbi:hypothetical protein QUN99_003394 [Vibrio parahaemolyticus]|nr:hypothetical protein [Vibrio parahaemolyticus]